jgi:CsoR family transcriptional regulator, copper-sensing transcriptional repressor
VAYPYGSDRDELLSRLKKIEGQVRGIHRMVEDGKDPVDVLTQIAAVVSGTEKVGLRLVREHVRTTLGPNGNGPDAKVDDILRVVERFLQA